MMNKTCGGTGAKPYQDCGTGLPEPKGNYGGNKPMGDTKALKTVADGGKSTNPQNAREVSVPDMKPEFYEGQAINQCGDDR